MLHLRRVFNRIKAVVLWQSPIDAESQKQFNKINLDRLKLFNLFGLLLSLILIAFSLTVIFRPIIHQNGNFLYEFWFSTLGTFTVQSNILITIIFVWYYFHPSCKVFKNFNLIVAVMTYITITFIGYNFFIGVRITYRDWANWSTPSKQLSALTSIWNHIFAPIFAVLYWLLEAKYFKKLYFESLNEKQSKKYFNTVWKGMIFPFIFLIYALIISLVNIYVVYNGFTNLNPYLGRSGSSLIVIKDNIGQEFNGFNNGIVVKTIQNITTNQDVFKNYSFGKIFNIVYYIVFVILFAGFLSLYRWSFNRIFFGKSKDKKSLKLIKK